MGDMVSYSGDGAADGYLATPRGGKAPGVVVIQEAWGLVPHIKDVADRLAREGFLALAPDLYHGKKTTEPDEARKLAMELDAARAVAEMRAAVSYLLAHQRQVGDAVGCVGWCMGGSLALRLAVADERVRAAVTYYGVPPLQDSDYAGLRATVLGHFAEHDGGRASPQGVKALEEPFRKLGKNFTFHTYVGTEHAFFNDTRPEVYRPDAARLSWERTIAFLRMHLGGD